MRADRNRGAEEGGWNGICLESGPSWNQPQRSPEVTGKRPPRLQDGAWEDGAAEEDRVCYFGVIRCTCVA